MQNSFFPMLSAQKSPDSPCRVVWVVGAAGLLGARLAQLCRQAGAAVCGLDLGPAAEVQGWVQDAPTLRRALALHGEPEVVYLCAATRGGDAGAYRAAYAEPVQALREALPQARLVFCSSTSVYAVGAGALVTEESPVAAGSARQEVLLHAEAEVLSAGGVVARLVALYAASRCELLRRHLAGLPQLPGAPERMLNYVHVSDAAHALLALGQAPLSGVFNVCGESFSKAEAYALMEELSGIPTAPEVARVQRRGASDYCVSSQRLRRLCGWAPQVSFRDFVRRQLG